MVWVWGGVALGRGRDGRRPQGHELGRLCRMPNQQASTRGSCLTLGLANRQRAPTQPVPLTPPAEVLCSPAQAPQLPPRHPRCTYRKNPSSCMSVQSSRICMMSSGSRPCSGTCSRWDRAGVHARALACSQSLFPPAMCACSVGVRGPWRAGPGGHSAVTGPCRLSQEMLRGLPQGRCGPPTPRACTFMMSAAA